MNEQSKIQALHTELSKLEMALTEAQNRYDQATKQLEVVKDKLRSLSSALSKVQEEEGQSSHSYYLLKKKYEDEIKDRSRPHILFGCLMSIVPLGFIVPAIMNVFIRRNLRELKDNLATLETDYKQNCKSIEGKKALLFSQKGDLESEKNDINRILTLNEREINYYKNECWRVKAAIRDEEARVNARLRAEEARIKAEERARILEAKVKEFSENVILSSEGYRDLIDYSVNTFMKVIKQQKPRTDEPMMKAMLAYSVRTDCVNYEYDEVEQKPSYSHKKMEPDQFVFSLHGKKNLSVVECYGLAWALSTLIIKEMKDQFPDGIVEASRTDEHVLLKYSECNPNYIAPQNWI